MDHNPLYYTPFFLKLQGGFVKKTDFVGNTHRGGLLRPAFDNFKHILNSLGKP